MDWRYAICSVTAALVGIASQPILAGVPLPQKPEALVVESFGIGQGLGQVSSDLPHPMVNAMAIQPDGRLLVAGNFTQVDQRAVDGIIRLQPSGETDPAFYGEGRFVDIRDIALQDNQKVVIGGRFGRIQGEPRPGLARLDSNGRIDPTFQPVPHGVGVVRRIHLQGEGGILLAGGHGVVRVDKTGRLDPGFQRVEVDGSRGILDLAEQPDGKVIIVGDFTEVNGTIQRFVARLNRNGTIDKAFPSSELAVDAPVSLVGVDSGGRVVIGGGFLHVSGLERKSLVRLNAEGTLDESFVPHSMDAPTALALQPDGKVLVSGRVRGLFGFHQSKIVRLLEDGSLDPSVYSIRTGIREILVLPEATAFVAGRAYSNNKSKRFDVAKLALDAKADLNLLALARSTVGDESDPSVEVWIKRIGSPDRIATIRYTTEGREAIEGKDFEVKTGFFVLEPGEKRKSVPVSLLDDSVEEDNEGFWLHAEALSPRTKIVSVPGGTFKVDLKGSAPITILDDDGPPPPPEPPKPSAAEVNFESAEYVINELKSHVDIEVRISDQRKATVAYETVGGTADPEGDYLPQEGTLEFSSWWQDSRRRGFSLRILDNAKAEGDRTFDVTLRDPEGDLVLGENETATITIKDNDNPAGAGQGADGTINASLLEPSSKVVIGGWFQFVDGYRRNHLARLHKNGALDTTFDPGAGPDGPVFALARQEDGKILVGGAFREFDGVSRNRIARIHPDGSLDTTFDPGSGWKIPFKPDNLVTAVRQIQPDEGGALYAVGDFMAYDGHYRPGIARILPDGSVDTSFVPSNRLTSPVRAIQILSDERLLIGRGSQLDRLHSDGTIDTTFRAGSEEDIDPDFQLGFKILSLGQQEDGKLLVGGGGSGLVRLNPDGATDLSFDPGLGQGYPSSIKEIHPQSDGTILVAGNVVQHPTQSVIAKLDQAGDWMRSYPEQLRGRLLSQVRTIDIQADGSIFLGGVFDGFAAEYKLERRSQPESFHGPLNANRSRPYYWLRLDPDFELTHNIQFDGIVRGMGGKVHLSLAGQYPPPFRVQGSSDLFNWQSIATNSTVNTFLNVTDTSASELQYRFYRIAPVPP